MIPELVQDHQAASGSRHTLGLPQRANGIRHDCQDEMKDDLLYLLMALVRKNYRDISRWVLRHGQVPKGEDVQHLAIEIMDTLDPYYGLTLEEIQLGGLINSLFGIVLRHGISIPAPYIHAARTFVVLEGVVRIASPSLELIPAIQPYLTDLLQNRWSPERVIRDFQGEFSEILSAVRSYPVHLAEVLDRAAEGRLHFETDVPGIEGVGQKMDQASSRIQHSVLAAGLLISSAILLFTQGTATGSLQGILGTAGFAAGLLLMVKLLLRG